jgi:hypothetical protein
MTSTTPSPSHVPQIQAHQPPVILEVKNRNILVGGTYTNSTSLYGMFREWVQNPPNLGSAIQRRQLSSSAGGGVILSRNKSKVQTEKEERGNSLSSQNCVARWKEIAKNEKLIHSQKRDLGFAMLRQRLID